MFPNRMLFRLKFSLFELGISCSELENPLCVLVTPLFFSAPEGDLAEILVEVGTKKFVVVPVVLLSVAVVAQLSFVFAVLLVQL